MARASSGGNSFFGPTVGASRGIIIVSEDFRDVILGRCNFDSSAPLEVLDVVREYGGVGRKAVPVVLVMVGTEVGSMISLGWPISLSI